VLAVAPVAPIGALGVLLLSGTAATVTGPLSVIWLNRRTSSDVRATMHSFLSQAESLGEIGGGFVLAALAQAEVSRSRCWRPRRSWLFPARWWGGRALISCRRCR